MSRCRTKNDNEKETEIIETEIEKTRPDNTKNTNTRLQCPHFWREPWIHAPFSLNNPRKIRIPYTVGFPGGISTCSAPTVASFNRSRPLPLFLFFFPLYFLSPFIYPSSSSSTPTFFAARPCVAWVSFPSTLFRSQLRESLASPSQPQAATRHLPPTFFFSRRPSFLSPSWDFLYHSEPRL